jgi:hypothetical protein
MSATIARITAPTASVTGLTVLSPYSYERRNRTVVHELVSGGIAISQIAANPVSGTVEVLFNVEADARALVTLLAVAGTYSLTESTMPTANMTFVPIDAVTIALDESTLTAWIVTIPYQVLA